MITGSTMSKIFLKGQNIMAHLFLIQYIGTKVIEVLNILFQGVLSHYTDVFAQPKSLPPTRPLSYYSLKPGTSLVSLRPYKYNYYQKEEVEKQIEETLSNDIIQHSHLFLHQHCWLRRKMEL